MPPALMPRLENSRAYTGNTGIASSIASHRRRRPTS